MSNTLFVGKVYYRFDELPSTNDWAAEIIALRSFEGQTSPAKTKPPEGTVVRAANQTAGRGQLGSQWHSSAGKNLLLSVIFYPTWLEAQAQFYLSMAVALALQDLGESMLPPESVSVKWPNDLYLGGKKAAGILIQNALSGSNLQSSIVGIGLNVNQLDFPDSLNNATSLGLVTGQLQDLDTVAARLFECLERRYLQLKAGNRARIKAEYEAKLWRNGENARFVRHADGSEFEGMILGVSERGMLRIETAAGVEVFEVKSVGFVI